VTDERPAPGEAPLPDPGPPLDARPPAHASLLVDSVPDPGPKPDADPQWGLVGRLPEVWPRVDSGLEIRGGGAVAVDTGTLRHTASLFVAAAAELEEVGACLGRPQGILLGLRDHAWDAVSSTTVLFTRLVEARFEAERIAAALREAAIAYELVELNAEHHAAMLAGDSARAASLDARVTRLSREQPDAWSLALQSEFDRSVMWPSELVRQATETGVVVGGEFGDPGGVIGGAGLGLGTLALAGALGVTGPGRLSRDARLSGSAGPISLTPVIPAQAPGAPQSLAAVTQRMPGAGDSRVRVERYTMPDGSRQFAVYIAGMQSFAYGGDDPWDNRSNHELYTGRQSDSFAATKEALVAAGAEPGDIVHAFGHSQGAMIGSHLALEGEYDTRTLVSFGSPVAADVGTGTLSVTVRHTDDPVAALAGGGHNAAVGAPGSFVAERVAHTEVGVADAAVPGHRMTAYAETAALVDASSDPRVGELRAVLGSLSSAESMEVTEYAATRREGSEVALSPSSAAAG
jgi:pimeloyl-ACP methyl ester carboxylesterase